MTGLARLDANWLRTSSAVADRYGWSNCVAHQACYWLVGREYERELIPLAAAERVWAVAWACWAGDD